MIDYRELLKKYINHVGEAEGVTFIWGWQGIEESDNFSLEEKDELKKLDQED